MALEIEEGKPTLHWDIGGTPEKLTSDKRVDDNVWYQVIVDRLVLKKSIFAFYFLVLIL